MGQEIGVQGLTLSSTSGVATVTSSPSTKVKAGGNGIYTDPLNVSVSGASQGNCQNASGAGTIAATSTKVKSENKAVMRKNDQGIITVNGTTVPGGNPCSFTVTVTITDAGQANAKAE